MALAAALTVYAFVAGVVHQALIQFEPELTEDAEGAFAAFWPIIPAVYLVRCAILLSMTVLERSVGLGHAALVASQRVPGRVSRWRLARRHPRLHGDCVTNVGLGPCLDCEAELRRYSARTLAPARSVTAPRR